MSAEDDADFLKRFSVALERNCGLARFHIRSVLLDEHDKPSIGPTPEEQHSSAGP